MLILNSILLNNSTFFPTSFEYLGYRIENFQIISKSINKLDNIEKQKSIKGI